MTLRERTEKAHALLKILNTVPAFVFDLFDYKAFGEYRLHPLLVEQLLTRRGQFNGYQSIGENLTRVYGARAAELAESLL